MNFVTAIDDIGSMNARSEGWVYLTIPETYLVDYRARAAAILAKTKLEAFHGKDFARRFANSYQAAGNG